MCWAEGVPSHKGSDWFQWMVAGVLLLVLVSVVACERNPDDVCNPKHPEPWCLERPTAWYLLIVHDYAVNKGLKSRIPDDKEWTVLGVFDTEKQCSDYYSNVPKTAEDYDRFWSCLPNTDPVLGRRRINWQGFPRPGARRTELVPEQYGEARLYARRSAS